MKLRLMAYSALMNQEVAFFDLPENSAGSICARLSNDVANIQGVSFQFKGIQVTNFAFFVQMTGMRIAMICQAISTLTSAIAIGFFFNWKLAAFTTIIMPFIAWAAILSSTLYTQQANEESKSAQRSSKLAIEVMNAMRTVVSMHKEDYFMVKFDSYLSEHFT